MASKRCTIVENAKPSNSKVVLIPNNMSTKEFINMASEKLGVHGKKVYLEDGGEIDDVAVIRDNDSVYVSAGEPFGKKANSAGLLTHSIAVMGPGSVGKSAMTLQYVQGVFVVDYDPTIEDAYRKNAVVDGEACVLDILDTAGQEDYTALRSTWMRERAGFVLVFSLTERSTFDDLQSFYDQLSVMHEDKIPPIVIAGNKVDLVKQRQVSSEEGNKLAESYRAVAYLETSAKTGQNIEKCFAAIVRDIRKQSQQTKRGDSPKRVWCSLL